MVAQKTDRSGGSAKKKKGGGTVAKSTKILDSIPTNSAAKKSAVAFGNIKVSQEVKDAMNAINEYFNDTDEDSIVDDSLREDCFMFIVDAMKKVNEVSKSQNPF